MIDNKYREVRCCSNRNVADCKLIGIAKVNENTFIRKWNDYPLKNDK